MKKNLFKIKTQIESSTTTLHCIPTKVNKDAIQDQQKLCKSKISSLMLVGQSLFPQREIVQCTTTSLNTPRSVPGSTSNGQRR